ncbi:MAG: metal-activated pyridoxal enzyme [Actinomycetia bacterium]|nr:metal-activated pyridoxal enzyme [Actinomycetes bacterium]MCP4224399.1 metal-activated pyridoxal enzyme [Actinomycetes bacterium]MCP5033693.1 metal-activated pyridoxal enzyme [Actinomycetes bacterium]
MSDPTPSTIDEIPTPALIVEEPVFTSNLALMSQARPGPGLRPHVKAFKSTPIARRLAAAGHDRFCGATIRELEGMAAAGLGADLLLANEVLDCRRLGRLVDEGANITVAVDSVETLAAAHEGGVRQVLIDVEVGLPRCGCSVDEAGPLADRARRLGLEVRGVMGYEGHLMMVEDRAERESKVEHSMGKLLAAHEAVGGDIISAGGTGTYAVNRWATEIQAGSYLLMDTQYCTLEIPFQLALTVLATVVSVSAKGWFVADAGLKALGMDHGNPSSPDGALQFCSDEHTTLVPFDGAVAPVVGDLIRLHPAHVDPTVARHEQMWVVDGAAVVDVWPIDLRHW